MNKNEETIEIYQNIDDELYEEWDKLYRQGAIYNLSPFWCKSWLKHFGKPENTKIVTIWEENKLKLLAPFYVRRNKLVLIGTKPDLYDELKVLYKDKKFLEKLFKYLSINNYQLNFRHLDAESEFSKELIKFLSINSINHNSHVDETKLYITKEGFNPSSSFNRDVNRNKRNIPKNWAKNICLNSRHKSQINT